MCVVDDGRKLSRTETIFANTRERGKIVKLKILATLFLLYFVKLSNVDLKLCEEELNVSFGNVFVVYCVRVCWFDLFLGVSGVWIFDSILWDCRTPSAWVHFNKEGEVQYKHPTSDLIRYLRQNTESRKMVIKKIQAWHYLVIGHMIFFLNFTKNYLGVGK